VNSLSNCRCVRSSARKRSLLVRFIRIGIHWGEIETRELEQRRRRRQRERRKKSNRFIAKTTTLNEQHTFLYISLSLLHDYNVKLFTFSGERERKTTILFRVNSRKIPQYLTNPMKWDKSNDWVSKSANSLLEWRFRCRNHIIQA